MNEKLVQLLEDDDDDSDEEKNNDISSSSLYNCNPIEFATPALVVGIK